MGHLPRQHLSWANVPRFFCTQIFLQHVAQSYISNFAENLASSACKMGGSLNILGLQNLFGIKNFSGPKNFPDTFLDVKFCGQIFLRTNNFWPKLFRTRLKFSRTNKFWTQIFLHQIFFSQVFLRTKSLWNPKNLGT